MLQRRSACDGLPVLRGRVGERWRWRFESLEMAEGGEPRIEAWC